MTPRFALGGWLLLAIAACGEPEPPPARSADRARGYRVSVPGELVGRFPPDPFDMNAEPLIEGAFGIAVSQTGQSMFVLDVMAGRVYHLDSEANLLAEIGRPGAGPGELQAPISIQADPHGGVWVADPQLNRLAHFGPDGAPIEELRTPHVVVNFAVLPDGVPVFPTLNARTLLATQREGASGWELDVDADQIPAELSTGPMERVSQGILGLAVLASDTVLLFRNKHSTNFRAWRVALGPGHERIDDVSVLPLPGWIYNMIEEETERFEKEVSAEWATGDFFVPFKSVRVVDGELWLAPGPSGRVIAFTVPRIPGDSASVILPSGDEVEGMLDAAVLGDRLVALYSTEVRVYQLERVASERFERPE